MKSGRCWRPGFLIIIFTDKHDRCPITDLTGLHLKCRLLKKLRALIYLTEQFLIPNACARPAI